MDTPFPAVPLQARPPLATAAGNVAKEEVDEAAWTERKPAVARALLPGPPPALQARLPLATTAGNVPKEEVGEAAWAERKPAVARALLLQNAGVPPGDEAGAMDMLCAPMSPIPLAFAEPDLPWVAGFDEIDSFLPWFDDGYSSI